MRVADTVAQFERLKAALAAKDRNAANTIVRDLIQERPALGRHWKALAAIAQRNGEVSYANRAMEYYASAIGGHDIAQYERAAILAQTGRLTEADAIMRSLPATVPTLDDNAYIRGTLATNMGHFAEARIHLRRAVEANPLSGQSWLALAMVGPIVRVDATAIERAEKSMQSNTVAVAERAAYLYALGKLRSQQEDHKAAFQAVVTGARLMQAERPYDGRRDTHSAAAAIDGWSFDAVTELSEELESAKASRPIFVTGLPRSGTTLVEQILVSHSAVDGGEELGLLRFLEQDMKGKRYADYVEYRRQGGSADKLRALYDHLLAERFGGNGRVIDKTLNSSRYIGLIVALFPDAPIVWLRRDPLDCAWSAYRTYFLKGLDWSWSLGDIAAHFKLEDDLFQHWSALLGDRILTVDYAALVTNPEDQIKRIVEHCGLALEPGQLAPHKTERTVTTASVAQVREPINRKGIGSAKPYIEFLKPFSDAYSG